MDRTAQTELARLLGRTLIERRDVYALQQPDGSYRPKVEQGTKAEQKLYVPIKLQDIMDHLDESVTIGHYLVSADNLCRVFCYDIDLRKAPTQEAVDQGRDTHVVVRFDGQDQVIDPRAIWAAEDSPMKQELALQLRMMAGLLADRVKELTGSKVLVTYSGSKGMHVYGVLDEHTPATDARDIARMVLHSWPGQFVAHRGDNFFRTRMMEGDNHPWRAYDPLEIEVFPKQDAVHGSDGIGNLLRLPLGLNRKSGKRGFFIDMTLGEGRLGKDDPMTALTQGSIR